MKRQTKLYNVLFPIWLLWLFPQVLAVVIPGNLAIDCLVLLLTLLALKHTEKGAVVKAVWWKFWLLGFAADLVGTAWMMLGWYLMELPALDGVVSYIDMVRPFTNPIAFFWTLAGVAIAGVCIYFFDKRAMRKCGALDGRQRHIIALTMAVVTAPWLFFLQIY